MKLKGFFEGIWVAQEIAAFVFVSAGLLVNFNFIQVVNPQNFVDLMVTLVYIVVVVNIISFIGWIITDYKWFEDRATGYTPVEEVITITMFIGFVSYFLMAVPMILWIISFEIIELAGVAYEKLLSLGELYVTEMVFVLITIGIIFLFVAFFQKISSVFEFTIIKRNKKKGESK